MKIIRGIRNIKEIHSNSVISIGNFDGMHLGHQKLFNKAYEIGKKHKIPTIVILFEPQPLEFLRKNNFPARITTLREKIKHIALCHIDIVLCIRFNNYFSSLSAEDFIINILINKLHVKFIIIGDNFKFGFQRNGNITLLKKLAYKHEFNVIPIPILYKNNIKISSTNIREALSQNNIKLASVLLGRTFSISGRVIHGKKIGRTLGFPTANVLLKKDFLLKNGVYAVKVRGVLNQTVMGISNIGVKPSYIFSKKNRILEVYLFNVNIDLYGKYIEIFIYKKIRNEKKFSSKEELIYQILQDIKTVKNYFNIN